MEEVFALFMLDVFAKKFKKSRATSLQKELHPINTMNSLV